MRTRLAWYARRLGRMTPVEVAGRLQDRWNQEVWTLAHARPGGVTLPPVVRPDRHVDASAVHGMRGALPAAPRAALLAAADQLLEGRMEILGTARDDLADPDWSLDPTSGKRYPERRSAFRVAGRGVDDDRQVKQVWELSRHHHLTVLAAAWQLTGDDAYAELAARHLRSWWRRNPPLSGINWASGIEIGIRLISWVWTRRLLDGWPGAPGVFEANDEAVRQVYWHQRYLATFPSRGSSANNHVIAEAAGQVVAACAFPWFDRSPRWRDDAIALLEAELGRNTFDSGVNREQAFEYHGLVAELGLIAGAEADAAGRPLRPETWDLLCRMLDVLAAVVDQAGRPPRQGDGDDGRALLLAAPGSDRWASLLAVGAEVFGRLPWWPATAPDASSIVLGTQLGRRVAGGPRPVERPAHFADAGLTVLRTTDGAGHEIWCRCDGGPHGFLSIGAHAHADALAVELRHRGVDILADPGTYCYQGAARWRAYFRSTLAHNTVTVDGRDQSDPTGPFMWGRQARTAVLDVAVGGTGPQRWSAQHDGYRALADPVVHRRTVTLDPRSQSLEILDEIDSAGPHLVQLVFHLGPTVQAELHDGRADLEWTEIDGTEIDGTEIDGTGAGGTGPRPGGPGTAARAAVLLPAELSWTRHHGETDPVLGWYAPAYGRRLASTTLVGQATVGPVTLRTTVTFPTG